MIKKLIFFALLTLLIFAYSYNYAFKQTKDPEIIIKNIMVYPMTEIVERCKKDHNYTDEDMLILEKELKRYLSLSLVKNKNDVGTGMYSKDVDNLWHAFILFTMEYSEFCNTYFGHFIHHKPETDMQRTPEKLQETRTDFRRSYKNIKRFLKKIFILFGSLICAKKTAVPNKKLITDFQKHL